MRADDEVMPPNYCGPPLTMTKYSGRWSVNSRWKNVGFVPFINEHVQSVWQAVCFNSRGGRNRRQEAFEIFPAAAGRLAAEVF